MAETNFNDYMIPVMGVFALVGGFYLLLTSVAAKLDAFTLKLLSAIRSCGFALRHLKRCCLNIRSYAKLHFNPTGLKIALGLNIGFAVRTFPRKTGIRRRPRRMRHRARRRRRR